MGPSPHTPLRGQKVKSPETIFIFGYKLIWYEKPWSDPMLPIQSSTNMENSTSQFPIISLYIKTRYFSIILLLEDIFQIEIPIETGPKSFDYSIKTKQNIMRLCDKHIPTEMSIGTFRQKCNNSWDISARNILVT